MPERLEAGFVERVREDLLGIVTEGGKGGAADLRLAVTGTRWAWAEDGKARSSGRSERGGLCARVFSVDGLSAGYSALVFGEEDAGKIEAIAREALATAAERAEASAARKRRARETLAPLADSLGPHALAPADPVRRTVIPALRNDPRATRPPELLGLAIAATREALGRDGCDYVSCECLSEMTESLFVSSDGASILQAFPVTYALLSLSGAAGGVRETIHDDIADAAGIEVLREGANVRRLDVLSLAREKARELHDLCRAEPCPTTDGPVTVVTDPNYNALLVHEIVGHPTEADRALKMETAYAGRTWLYRRPDRNMLGRRIASDLVSAFSDPSLPGLGHYAFDDEGMPGRRVVHIERGIFRGFMNSRRTAAALGAEPNGHAKVNRVEMVPLIRMSSTCFAAGESDPRRMIAEVDRGFWLVGMRTPSIAESRENFRISARLTWEIRDGKPVRLLRGGSMTADTRDYLMSVDAVGNDFELHPILTCGKGQPMQSKRLGNGAPTLRGKARVVGPEVR